MSAPSAQGISPSITFLGYHLFWILITFTLKILQKIEKVAGTQLITCTQRPQNQRLWHTLKHSLVVFLNKSLWKLLILLLIKAGWNLMHFFRVGNKCNQYQCNLGLKALFLNQSITPVIGRCVANCPLTTGMFLCSHWGPALEPRMISQEWWDCHWNLISCVCVYQSVLWVSSKVLVTAVQENIEMVDRQNADNTRKVTNNRSCFIWISCCKMLFIWARLA